MVIFHCYVSSPEGIHGCFTKFSSRTKESKLSLGCCADWITPDRRARRMNPFGFCCSVLQILGRLRINMSHPSPKTDYIKWVDKTKYSHIHTYSKTTHPVGIGMYIYIYTHYIYIYTYVHTIYIYICVCVCVLIYHSICHTC